MTPDATGRDAGMLHAGICKAGHAVVTSLTGKQRWKVRSGLADDAGILSVVAGCALIRNARVVVTLHQETGRTGVASIATQVGLHMLGGLGCGTDAAADGMAARAIPGRIFEYSVNVTLLTTQGGVNIPELEPCLRMIK